MRKTLMLVVLLSAALTACGSGGSDDVFAVSDPAKQIEAGAGKEFKLVIESNPSTGYHWELAEELDESIVQFVSREYRAGEPVMPGSGGVDVWIFKAVAPGEAQITLGYYPPSNDAQEPEQTATFTVIVK